MVPCAAGEPPGTCRLTDRDLTHVPPELPPDTELLYLDSNHIEYISKGTVQFHLTLVHLDLQNNQFSTITRYSFTWAPNLEQLNLGSNLISHISDFAFCSLENLSRLELHNNRLQKLGAKIFDCLRQLTTLLLHNNQLVTLEIPARFHFPPNLELSLSGNPLECDTRLEWLKRGSIQFQRGQAPQCHNYPGVPFNEVDLGIAQHGEYRLYRL